jgi:hypothetical protein
MIPVLTHTPLYFPPRQGHTLPVILSFLLVILLYLHLYPSLSPLPLFRSSQDCHPYHAYGHLSVSLDVPEHNRWHPFDPSCQSPELFRAFRRKIGRESEKVKLAERDGQEGMEKRGKGENIEFARGRTVLMLGDSTVREQVRRMLSNHVWPCILEGAMY